jgi:Tfp pilus assembly protein PilX
MKLSGEITVKNEKGFAFIVALLLTLLLTALGVLVFTLTTRDIRSAVKMTGEKYAMNNAEICINRLNYTLNTLRGNIPDNYQLLNFAIGATGDECSILLGTASPTFLVSGLTEAGTQISTSGAGSSASRSIVIPKQAIGRNNNYGSQMVVDFATAYGPLPNTSDQPASGG